MTEYNITYLIMRAEGELKNGSTGRVVSVDYQRVEVTQDGKGFYYIGDEGKSLYCYHIDSKENEKIVQAEEVGAEKVTVEGVSEEGILFRAFPENELYVKMRKESVI